MSFIIGGIDRFFFDARFFCLLLKRRVWNTSASKQHRSESIKVLNCFSNRLIFIDLCMFGFGHLRFFVAIFFIRKEACFEIQGGSDDRCFVTSGMLLFIMSSVQLYHCLTRKSTLL